MFTKNIMKFPVLIMGLVMFGIFVSQDTTKIWWDKVKVRYIPSTCKSIQERVIKKSPDKWNLECKSIDFLIVTIPFDKELKKKNMLRVAMYRQIANLYKDLARFANTPLHYIEDGKQKTYNEIETLERLQNIQLVLEHPTLKIITQSDGQAVAKFLKLRRPEDIANHLKLTVKVGEKRL
jgi:translation initiation factor 2B subunit (eIF-2B alpha/beta/delta family)